MSQLYTLAVRLWERLGATRIGQFLARREWVFALLVFGIFWGGLLSYFGTVTSGYHLIDDHEMLRISQDLQTSDPFSVSVKWIGQDLQARFRPMYFVYRTFSIWALGTDFTSLSVALLVMAVLTSALLYLFARKIGFGRVGSFLFTMLAVVGTQSAIWWRLGPSESIGMFWLAMGLFFMARAVYNIRSQTLANTVISVISLIEASMSKESFVVLLPVVALWWVLLYRQHRHVTWRIAFTKHTSQLLVLAAACVAELYLIFVKVGTTGIGYAGADSQSLSFRRIMGTLRDLVMQTNPWLLLLLMVLALMALAYSYARAPGVALSTKFKARLPFLKEIIYTLVVIGLWALSQAVIYAKSGVYERYLNPGTIGLAFLAVYLLAFTVQQIRPAAAKRWALVILIILCLGSLKLRYSEAHAEAYKFTTEGIEVNKALTKTLSATKPDDVIVVVADSAYDFEASQSTLFYLQIQGRRPQLAVKAVWSRPQTEYTAFLTELGNYYNSLFAPKDVEKVADKSRIQAVFTYKETDTYFLQQRPGWFSLEMYERNDFGKFIVYFKK